MITELRYILFFWGAEARHKDNHELYHISPLLPVDKNKCSQRTVFLRFLFLSLFLLGLRFSSDSEDEDCFLFFLSCASFFTFAFPNSSNSFFISSAAFAHKSEIFCLILTCQVILVVSSCSCFSTSDFRDLARENRGKETEKQSKTDRVRIGIYCIDWTRSGIRKSTTYLRSSLLEILN